MKVSISNGNSKLGSIPNVSLLPCKDCGEDVPCKQECYAVNICRYAPSAKKAWQGNSAIAHKFPDRYFATVREYLSAKAPSFFRWHVSGDFLGQDYLDEVKAIAKEFPSVKFLAFTKRHDLSFAKLPSNLTVIFSMWPNWTPSMRHVARLPKAWMQNGQETRLPSNALYCPGDCEQCGMCWNLPSLHRDVVFQKH